VNSGVKTLNSFYLDKTLIFVQVILNLNLN
jgi:hypothetical protein